VIISRILHLSIQSIKKILILIHTPSLWLTSRTLHHNLRNRTSGRSTRSHSLGVRNCVLCGCIVILRRSVSLSALAQKFILSDFKEKYLLCAPRCLGTIHDLLIIVSVCVRSRLERACHGDIIPHQLPKIPLHSIKFDGKNCLQH
jgi:hypothetical protein